jgi:protein TonB
MRVPSLSSKSARTSAIIVATSVLALSATSLYAQGASSATTPETAAVPAPQPPAAAAAKKAPPSPKVLAAWRGKVLTHLNSRKREFGGADGTATVAFKIDRSGKVMSAQLVSTSGNKALDAEAVAMTQRASPVPAPPADIAGDTLYLKVPIRFKR